MGKEVQTVLRPAVEDSARSPSSVLLRASSRADFVGVSPYCLPHCHTTFNWSLPSLIVVFLSVRLCFFLPQGLGLATGARLTQADRLACSHLLAVHISHASPSTPLWMAWQTACQSSSTSGGLHLLSPTFVVSKVGSPPSSTLRSVNSSDPSRRLRLHNQH